MPIHSLDWYHNTAVPSKETFLIVRLLQSIITHPHFVRCFVHVRLILWIWLNRNELMVKLNK